MKHFEEVWTKAEEVSAQDHLSREEIYLKLQDDLREYSKFDAVPSNEIKKILKTKKLGEILFEVTKLSRLDNVNSWAALDMEIRIAENKVNSDPTFRIVSEEELLIDANKLAAKCGASSVDEMFEMLDQGKFDGKPIEISISGVKHLMGR